MIYYVVTRKHQFTVDRYVADSRGRDMGRMEVLHYEDLPDRTTLPTGTYIFSDLERLSPSELGMAADVADQLAAAGHDMRILNHPRKSLLRADLLRALHAAGVNSFTAYRIDEAASARLPAFVRQEHTHTGGMTPPLTTREELDRAITSTIEAGADPHRLLVVEYCETADADGTYHKFGAFLIGERVIPRHRLSARHWVTKQHVALSDDHVLAAEREYLETNPHEAWIRRVFALANLEYGRIDYGIKDAKPQAWEINTNPWLLSAPRGYSRRHRPQQERFAARLPAAFADIDHHGPPGVIKVRIQPAVPRMRRPWSVRRFARRVGRGAARRRPW